METTVPIFRTQCLEFGFLWLVLKIIQGKKKKTGITSELVVSHLRQAERANRTAVGSQSSHSDPHTSLYMDSYTRAIN